MKLNYSTNKNNTNLRKTRAPPTPLKQKWAVSSLAMKEQKKVEGTPLVIGQVTVVVVVAAGGGQEAEQVGPRGTAAAEE